MIKLADMTISNAVGTHIGYCIYLNRPHYIFSQSVNYIANSTMEEKRIKNIRNQNQEIETEMEETQEIENAFSEYRLEIKDSQRGCGKILGNFRYQVNRIVIKRIL